ncbi:hypothetical protein Ahy_B10g102373 [Arachis hypogaea]|uniref:SWIM-type domain-containing protein n=1 Tax=Arachis hypogaea TaxID=3818 RepID=A0A444X1K7_ARAHY|nr:hypothetical protein Ahy_B10g102373 [Arachis hypogaea]
MKTALLIQDTGVKNVNSESRSRVNKNQKEKILRNIVLLTKGKEKILVEDDAFVHEVSDEEVDLGFIGSFAEGVEYGLDPGADSDGANSWHSEEMKTPPNVRNADHSQKQGETKQSYWSAHTGDNGYEKFEVHRHPTNHVVDLGKRLCTCQFWMLTGIPLCAYMCCTVSG